MKTPYLEGASEEAVSYLCNEPASSEKTEGFSLRSETEQEKAAAETTFAWRKGRESGSLIEERV